MFVVNQSVSGKELYSPEEGGGGGGGLGVELGAGAGKVTSRTNSFEIENLLKVTIKKSLHFLYLYFISLGRDFGLQTAPSEINT